MNVTVGTDEGYGVLEGIEWPGVSVTVDCSNDRADNTTVAVSTLSGWLVTCERLTEETIQASSSKPDKNKMPIRTEIFFIIPVSTMYSLLVFIDALPVKPRVFSSLIHCQGPQCISRSPIYPDLS